jgi:hypothetical protein
MMFEFYLQRLGNSYVEIQRAIVKGDGPGIALHVALTMVVAESERNSGVVSDRDFHP